MENDTIHETADEIILRNPEPIRAAPKRVQKRLTALVHRYLDLKHVWEARTAWLNEMLGKMQNWLGRDDLSEGARSEGDRIKREFENGPEL